MRKELSIMSHHNSHVPWREWSDEAFAEAKARDLPILLDIGAVWCHWCHVMDDGIPGDPVHSGTYSHPEVLERIEESFIPIKVDNDKRPDINARYNMGGWPTTAFLNPDGEMIYGETYVPPARMVQLMDYISDLYKNQRDELEKETVRMRAERARALAEADATLPEAGARALDTRTAENVANAVKAAFDFAYGGFGRQPKFPHPAALLFTLERYARTGDPELRAVAEKTMQGMDSGGMYDKYAGGFFRYSTTRDWSIPHYEKMLEDNALLTKVYAVASVVLGDERYMQTVRSAHGWLLSDMYDAETGTFAGSQDADEEEHYYGKPLDERAKLPTPYIDRTVYANWNALMVTSLATRYQLTGEPETLDAARRAFAFLRTALTTPADGSMGVPPVADAGSMSASPVAGAPPLRLLHYHDGTQPGGSTGLLIDQTAFTAAALDLYESTGEREYLHDAVRAVACILTDLAAPDGGFNDLKPRPDAIGELGRPKKEIGENADAALALLRLSAHTGDAACRQAALGALEAFSGEYERYAYFAASYARAVEAALRPPLHIVVVGERGESRTEELLHAAWHTVHPGSTVEILDMQRVTGDELAARGYPAGGGAPRAYVCIGETCLAPVETADELAKTIGDALGHGRRGGRE
jgi:uncharacterized protein YyaL (SSP411 family)